MSEKFKVTFQAEDGYAGGSRPLRFSIDADDLNEDMSDDELEDFFYERMDEAFRERVTPVSSDLDEFIAWAKDIAAAK